MMSPRLFHVSEDPNIERFEPRPPKPVYSNLTEPVVWAVDIWRVVNYLLPRDCPRVTFYATSKSKPEDVERLLGTNAARHVVAVEWDGSSEFAGRRSSSTNCRLLHFG